MVILNYIKTIISALLIIVIVSLSIAISCQRERIQALEANNLALSEKVQLLQDEAAQLREREKHEENERRRADLSVLTMLKGVALASAKHKERMEGLSKAEEEEDELSEWLDCPIPKSVSSLFDCTASKNRVCAH
ncbi:MAG: hypothetical protein M0Q90_16700 [Bacteroidales bacterium]|jgi:predicted  nucleic acid-binding Zn-ribbon protein|nr:hypothetical protein [Bacteroidales bacterium]